MSTLKAIYVHEWFLYECVGTMVIQLTECILKLLKSDSVWVTGSPDGDLSWFSSVSPGNDRTGDTAGCFASWSYQNLILSGLLALLMETFH